MPVFIEKTAVVHQTANIGDGTKVWNFAQIRENATVGRNCVISNGVYIDSGVTLGDNVSVQNKSTIYRNTVIEDDVFIGPGVCFANDKKPRSGVIRDLRGTERFVRKGASIGAGAIIMPDVDVGSYSMVGAGSLVVEDVPSHGLVYGSPARLCGFVCICGSKLENVSGHVHNKIIFTCRCGLSVEIPLAHHSGIHKNSRSDISNSVALAKSWLTSSGIQNVSVDTSLNGGFNAWYDTEKKSYPFIYSEITGYGITMLLYFYTRTGESVLLDRAKVAAEWLIRTASHDLGGVKTRYYYGDMLERSQYSFESEILYSFDNAMVLYGFANLHRITGDRKYLERAVRMADFLRGLQKPDGTFFAAYDARNDSFIDTDDKWSTQSGSYHAKIAMGMLDMHRLTENDDYLESARSVCRAAMKFQERDGRFVTSRRDGSTHMHPHCYSAEGLLYAGTRLGENRFVESALDAAKWALDMQLETGGVPCIVSSRPNINERSDTVAQVLRLSLAACRFREIDTTRIEKLKKRLLEFQNTDIALGGFFYGRDENGNTMNHLNSWCTMFSTQALDMYHRRQTGKAADFEMIV